MPPADRAGFALSCPEGAGLPLFVNLLEERGQKTVARGWTHHALGNAAQPRPDGLSGSTFSVTAARGPSLPRPLSPVFSWLSALL